MIKILRKIISLAVILSFAGTSVYIPKAQAGEMVLAVMPMPGKMVNLSQAYIPAHLNGITINPKNALQFDFLIHKGQGSLTQDQKQEEYTKLVKYFLASLTIPEADQWVNLSPYEKGRIIDTSFGKTEMGRDLLGQDYLLKQITSSLMYPESGLGKKFWDKVYERAFKEYGNTNIPVNTFNKVWIMPDEALVYESGNSAYILKSHLKVMLEEDYLSLEHNAINGKAGMDELGKAGVSKVSNVTSKIVKEVILPEIEKEVNEGKNFAMLRQIYSGMILAAWYKRALKESLLGQVYANKGKVAGVNQDPKNNQVIYEKYLAAFKKGVYNYIKEDTDKYSNQTIPRKYFAGGFASYAMGSALDIKSSNQGSITDLIRKYPEIASTLGALGVGAGSLEIVNTLLGSNLDRAPKTLGASNSTVRLDWAMKTATQLVADFLPADTKEAVARAERPNPFKNVSTNLPKAVDEGNYINISNEKVNIRMSKELIDTNLDAQDSITVFMNGFKVIVNKLIHNEYNYSIEPASANQRASEERMEFEFPINAYEPYILRSNEMVNIIVAGKYPLIGTPSRLNLLVGEDMLAIPEGKLIFLPGSEEFSILLLEGIMFEFRGRIGTDRLKKILSKHVSEDDDGLRARFLAKNPQYVQYDRDPKVVRKLLVEMIVDNVKIQAIRDLVKAGIDPLKVTTDSTFNATGRRLTMSVPLAAVKNMTDAHKSLNSAVDPFGYTRKIGNVIIPRKATASAAMNAEVVNESRRNFIALITLAGASATGLTFKAAEAATTNLVLPAARQVWTLNPEVVNKKVLLEKYFVTFPSMKKTEDGRVERISAQKIKIEYGDGVILVDGVKRIIRPNSFEAPLPIMGITKEEGIAAKAALASQLFLEFQARKLDVSQEQISDFVERLYVYRPASQAMMAYNKIAVAAVVAIAASLSNVAYAQFREMQNMQDMAGGQLNAEIEKRVGQTKLNENDKVADAEFWYKDEKTGFATGKKYSGKTGFIVTKKVISPDGVTITIGGAVFSDRSVEPLSFQHTFVLPPARAEGFVDYEKLRAEIGRFETDSAKNPNVPLVTGTKINVYKPTSAVLKQDDKVVIPGSKLPGNSKDSSKAMNATGGIDLNAANMSMIIKRDGNGVPLPLNMQDMKQLMNIQGFVPNIIEIRPVTSLPILTELQQKIQSQSSTLASAS